MAKVLGLVTVLQEWVVRWVVGWVVCRLGCLLARKEVNVERVMYLSSKNSNILLRLCPNRGRIWIGDVGDDRC